MALKSYGLSPHLIKPSLKLILEKFEAYKSELFNLERDRRGVVESSMRQQVYMLMGYLGFCARWGQVEVRDFTPFLNPTTIIAFISFLLERKLKRSSILGNLSAIIQVTKWMVGPGLALHEGGEEVSVDPKP